MKHEKVNPEVVNFAAAAYDFHRELFHPLPDHTQVKITRDRFDAAWSALSVEDREMLHRRAHQ